MKKYVEEMLKDLKRSYKLREEQLADAATKYKKRSDNVIARHEELLVAYRSVMTSQSFTLLSQVKHMDHTQEVQIIWFYVKHKLACLKRRCTLFLCNILVGLYNPLHFVPHVYHHLAL